MSDDRGDRGYDDAGKKIRIEIDEKNYEAPKAEMTGRELKQLGGVPGNYRLFQEIEGGTDKQIGDSDQVHLKGGEEFYSLPLGTVGGPLEDRLATEIAAMQSDFPGTVMHEDAGNRHVHIPGVALPEGWNRKHTELLLPIPPQYPSTAIPGFEADSELRRSNGAQPAGTGVQQFDGKQYLHFCWNPSTFTGEWVSLEQAARFAISRFSEST
jgi:hypothetical protein